MPEKPKGGGGRERWLGLKTHLADSADSVSRIRPTRACFLPKEAFAYLVYARTRARCASIRGN